MTSVWSVPVSTKSELESELALESELEPELESERVHTTISQYRKVTIRSEASYSTQLKTELANGSASVDVDDIQYIQALASLDKYSSHV